MWTLSRFSQRNDGRRFDYWCRGYLLGLLVRLIGVIGVADLSVFGKEDQETSETS